MQYYVLKIIQFILIVQCFDRILALYRILSHKLLKAARCFVTFMVKVTDKRWKCWFVAHMASRSFFFSWCSLDEESADPEEEGERAELQNGSLKTEQSSCFTGIMTRLHSHYPWLVSQPADLWHLRWRKKRSGNKYFLKEKPFFVYFPLNKLY